MLAREAFREMLFPLSEKELHYREHPEDSLIYFKNFRYEGEATVVTLSLIHISEPTRRS